MLGESYFTIFTWEKAIFYIVAILYVSGCCIAVTIQPFMTFACDLPNSDTKYENPSYSHNPCNDRRHFQLLFMTVNECQFARRILAAVILGGIIGWERRQADRPAGIRTMSLVALGSCLFSICSAFAFIDGPMAWDASRVAAAIPSGVGFLGSALIFKQNTEGSHTVHGLTTAASVWLSAAVGIACGGGLYFVASFCTAIVLVLLRFGPRTTDDEDDDEEDERDAMQIPDSYNSIADAVDAKRDDPEAQRLLGSPMDGSSQRSAKTVRHRPPSLV